MVHVISIAVAFLVGAAGLASLAAEALDTETGPLAWIAGLDLKNAGFMIVGVLLTAWLIAVAYWKIARVEPRATR